METQHFCQNCGQPNPEGSEFCTHCGAKLNQDGQAQGTHSVHAAYFQEPESTTDSPSTPADTASLVCGILSIFIRGFILSIVAICLGWGHRKTNKSAKAGVICGFIGIALCVICLIYIIAVWINLVRKTGPILPPNDDITDISTNLVGCLSGVLSPFFKS